MDALNSSLSVHAMLPNQTSWYLLLLWRSSRPLIAACVFGQTMTLTCADHLVFGCVYRMHQDSTARGQLANCNGGRRNFTVVEQNAVLRGHPAKLA
ncbi:hypothetical protein C8R47DRAFT_124506 [Mycena vitilis]|nr:hypothetical protein C8R47DRAFT_124506 [Mycena vitilis]